MASTTSGGMMAALMLIMNAGRKASWALRDNLGDEGNKPHHIALKTTHRRIPRSPEAKAN
jgi:hypothetical protein